MPIIYNIEPAKIDLFAVQRDSISLNFNVTAEILSSGTKIRAEAFNIPALGSSVHLDVVEMSVRRKDGLLLKSWTSIGTPCNISINPLLDGEFEIDDIDGFLESGVFDYDCRVVDLINDLSGTIMTGSFYIKKQIL